MISEWLELDATDDWVRHDAEIVRVQALPKSSCLSLTLVFTILR